VAPSSYNNQSWRFIYARRGTPPGRRSWGCSREQRLWARNGAALVVIASKSTYDFNGAFSLHALLRRGRRLENFALRGPSRALVVHGMEGFDTQSPGSLGIPED